MNEKQKKTTEAYRSAYDQIFGKKSSSEKSARGARGYLMRSGEGHFFRIYNKTDSGFVDYDIVHYDMEIEILEDDAIFVEKDGKHYIDYSRETLGFDQS